MKGILEFFAMFSLGRIFSLLSQICKAYLLRFYVGIVDGIRAVYFILVATILCLLVFFCGFLMLHVALFLYLPWTLSEKIALMTALGVLYTIAPLVLMGFLQSRTRFQRAARVHTLFDNVDNEK